MNTPSFWAVLPATIRYDDSLPPSARLLYAEISSLTNDVGYCFAQNEYFAKVFHLNLKSVQRLIKALSDRGYIAVEVVRDPQTKEVKTRRIFAGLNPAKYAEPSPQKYGDPSPQKYGDPSPQNCGDPSPQKCGIEQLNKFNNIPPIVPQGTDEQNTQMLFDRFWKAYPKKRDKLRARKAWIKLNPDMELCRVMARALEQQKQSSDWLKDGGAYIPNPSTWLNNRRWEDEADELPAASGTEEEGVTYI